MPAEEKKDIDPLQRVFVPIEKKTADGTIIFRTTDNQVYHRLADGSIRRETPKINGKLARKLRARVHRKA